jgi:alpha,alpha-trehalase
LLVAHPPSGRAQSGGGQTARFELRRLLAEVDRDGDGRITARDEIGLAGGLRFRASLADGGREIVGHERLAELAFALALDARRGLATRVTVTGADLGRPRGEVLRALIRRSWPLLVRQTMRVEDFLADARARIELGLATPGPVYIYVSADDAPARQRLEREAASWSAPHRVVVRPLPRKLGATWFGQLERERGLLHLPRPYLVPGGRFREMYGWDTYFMAKGALADGHRHLALDALEDLLYQIERYGKIGNSNRSLHRGRSQPPFTARLALEVAAVLPPGRERQELLRRAARAAERELVEIWEAPPRMTSIGLSRYHDEADGPTPEVPVGRYRYWPLGDLDFFRHDRAVRESGWDVTHRFGRRAHRIAPVCLNALLYGTERDLAAIHRELDGPTSPAAAAFEARARARRARIDRFLWDEQRGLYFDHDVDLGRRTDYEHVAWTHALFVGVASPEQARRVASQLHLFEMPGGLAVGSERSRRRAGGEDFQWDWPYGWAPLHVLADAGLRRYGHHREADRISGRWLAMVEEIAARNNGLVVEKYDVVKRSAHVPHEYGNQGGDRGPLATYRGGCRAWPRAATCVELLPAATGDGPLAPVGFGWTNASISLLQDARNARGQLSGPPSDRQPLRTR